MTTALGCFVMDFFRGNTQQKVQFTHVRIKVMLLEMQINLFSYDIYD